MRKSKRNFFLDRKHKPSILVGADFSTFTERERINFSMKLLKSVRSPYIYYWFSRRPDELFFRSFILPSTIPIPTIPVMIITAYFVSFLRFFPFLCV